MMNRRDLMTGFVAAAAASVFSGNTMAQEAAILKPLHKYGANNFYFNIAEQAYNAAFKEPLRAVKSADELAAVLGGEKWGLYKQAALDSAAALMPQIEDDAVLKILKKPKNFDNLRKADSDRYREGRIEKNVSGKVAANPLFVHIRALAEDRIIEFPQAAALIEAIDTGDFYNQVLPAFIADKAAIQMDRLAGQAPASSKLKFD